MLKYLIVVAPEKEKIYVFLNISQFICNIFLFVYLTIKKSKN